MVGRTVVAAVLVTLGGLALLGLAPQAAGLEGHVVVSGSMQPRIAPGDVVLTRAVTPAELQPGQVILFPDPERPDRLILHRLVSVDAQGDLITRGDANQSNDSTPVPAASVIGRAQLRVPWIGLPAYWRSTGQWGAIALVAGLLAAATAWVTRRAPRRTAVTRSPHDDLPARAGGHRAGHRAPAPRGRHRVGTRLSPGVAIR